MRRRSKVKGQRSKVGELSALLAFAFCLSPLGLPLSVPRPAIAQESPAQWLARIFDPATLGIESFPGATLNRKQSVDAVVLERGGDKRIAIYIIPPDQLQVAADHFAKQLGVAPEVTGAGSPYVTYTFDFTGSGKGPAKLHGLRIVVSRAPFVDNKGQITMECLPPKAQ